MDESGAGYLASIFGTEKDKVNCSFFFKTGSCRHGDVCSRAHNRPTSSQTILIRNLYIPVGGGGAFSVHVTHEKKKTFFSRQMLKPGEDPQEHFEDFYEDIFSEMAKHGRVVDMVVCENAGVHLAGNTYIKFEDEDQAAAAMAAVQGRFYAGRPLQAEFTPVTDFWEGICKQLEKEGACGRSMQCNFMHLKKIGPDLEADLYPNGRGGSRGYSGGAYGRTERPGFENRSSYDRGSYRTDQRRNWNDRRPYDRREHDPHHHSHHHSHHQPYHHQPPPPPPYSDQGPPPPPHRHFRDQGPPPPPYFDAVPPPPPPHDAAAFDPYALPPPYHHGSPYPDYAAPPPPPPYRDFHEPPRHRNRSRSPVRHHH